MERKDEPTNLTYVSLSVCYENCFSLEIVFQDEEWTYFFCHVCSPARDVVGSMLDCLLLNIYIYIYRVSREECARLRENVSSVKIH